MATDTLEQAESLLAALKLEDGFLPHELHSETDSGLSATLIEELILKYLSGVGSASGRAIADHICLPLVVLERRLCGDADTSGDFAGQFRRCWAIMCIA